LFWKELLLEKAKVEPDESIIGAATDQKNFSSKRIEVFCLASCWLGYALCVSFKMLLGTPGQWDGVIPVIVRYFNK